MVSGGVDWGGYVEGVSTVADRPDPTSGTPTDWFVEVANVGTETVTVTGYAVCTTPTGAANSSARTVHKPVKVVFTKLSKISVAAG